MLLQAHPMSSLWQDAQFKWNHSQTIQAWSAKHRPQEEPGC